MTLTVRYVHQNNAAQSWPLVEPHLAEAIPYSEGDYTIEQVKVMVNIGQWLLLVAIDENNNVCGAATISFVNGPNHRTAFITLIGGKLITNSDTFKQMGDILRSNGATRLQGMVRPSIARLSKRYGLYERTTLVEAML